MNMFSDATTHARTRAHTHNMMTQQSVAIQSPTYDRAEEGTAKQKGRKKGGGKVRTTIIRPSLRYERSRTPVKDEPFLLSL